MPDLTIEYYWMCKDYHDSMTEHPNDKPQTKCTWNQYYDGGEPYDNKCPSCGGDVTSVPHAV